MLYGDEITEYTKKLAANAEEFLNTCGQKPMEIYRIINFTPTPLEEQYFGQFFDGDSYVIVVQNEKDYDIHYWEGVDSTADETGSAAAFSVQLSDRFSKPSRHHLELMNEETQLFMSRFPDGIKYLHGGAESGFKHYTPEVHVPTLFQVKGKRYPRCFQMEMKTSSLNEGDVFVLDLDTEIQIWTGKEANKYERVAAMNFANGIKNRERKGKPTLHHTRDVGGEIEQRFWASLEGSQSDVQPPMPDEEESNASEEERMKYRFWQISDDSGKIVVSEITERPLTQKMLMTDQSYILETYDKIHVWQGKNASINEKRSSMTIASKYKKEWNKPKGTPITRIPQGTEDAMFRSYFEGFYQNEQPPEFKQEISALANKQLKAASLLMDQLGANWTATVYRVNDDFKAATMIADDYEKGKFFRENCYIVDVKSSQHRYSIIWDGFSMPGDKHAKVRQIIIEQLC